MHSNPLRTWLHEFTDTDYKIADVDSNWEVRRQRYMEIHGTQFDNEHALEKDTSQLIAMLQEINTRVRFAAASMA